MHRFSSPQLPGAGCACSSLCAAVSRRRLSRPIFASIDYRLLFAELRRRARVDPRCRFAFATRLPRLLRSLGALLLLHSSGVDGLSPTSDSSSAKRRSTAALSLSLGRLRYLERTKVALSTIEPHIL